MHTELTKAIFQYPLNFCFSDTNPVYEVKDETTKMKVWWDLVHASNGYVEVANPNNKISFGVIPRDGKGSTYTVFAYFEPGYVEVVRCSDVRNFIDHPEDFERNNEGITYGEGDAYYARYHSGKTKDVKDTYAFKFLKAISLMSKT